MSYTRPSRLYRMTKAYPRPLFSVQWPRWIDHDDDSITSITIRRGKSSPGGGTDPTIVTLGVNRPAPNRPGDTITVRMTDAFAAALAPHLGVQAPDITRRAVARVGAMRTTDTGKRQVSEITATSWIAQASISPNLISAGTNRAVSNVIVDFLRPPAIADRIGTIWVLGAWDQVMGFTDETYSSYMGKVTRDIGNLVRPMRDGSTQIMAVDHRRDTAIDRSTSLQAIGRRQALSPATWEQPTDIRGNEYVVTYTDGETNQPAEYVTGAGAARSTVDWTHIRWISERYKLQAQAMRAQGLSSLLTVPEVRFDMVALIRSANVWDRTIAGQLLHLEQGDAVTLGGDWHPSLRGIFFAEGITETISANGWEIALSLVPYSWVVGETSPAIPAHYWDQAVTKWDDETRAWDAA